MKQVVAIISIIFYLSFFNWVRANVIISEILYSPTTGQWIEIYNDTDSSIDLIKYKILDSGASTNGHSISAVSGGTNLVPAHSFAVVAKAPDNFGTVSFLLFKSSLGIKVSEDIVKLKNNAEAIIDSVSIDGSAIDGKSLQKISGTWTSATPTPGKINEVSSSPATPPITPSEDTTNTNNSSSSSSASSINKTAEIKTKITARDTTFVGFSLPLKASVTGVDGRPLFYGRYFWNFGDGDSKEMKVNTGGDTSHIYFYPGEYTVFLEYYVNDYGEIPDASTSILVKIIGADILISSVGNEQDFFIELSNNTDKDVDISKWMLTSGDKRFIFPKNTIIPTKKKIIFSPFVTGFTFSDKNNLKLVSSEWKTVFDYGGSLVPLPTPKLVAKNKISYAVSSNASPVDVTPETLDQNYQLEDTSDLNLNLEAQAIASKVNIEKNKNSYFLIVVLFVLLVAGGGAVYFIRNLKNKEALEIGEDFDILEE